MLNMSQQDEQINSIISKAKSDGNTTPLRDLLKENNNKLKGLVIDGYIGDFPTFIEPVYLKPGIKIGDTVLLGPNAYINEGCDLGTFSELANVILSKNVKTGKLTKLSWCVVESDIILPEKFEADNCFIIKDETGKIKTISF